jgi:hypothetical protein
MWKPLRRRSAVDGDVGKKLRAINPDPHFEQIERVVTIVKLCDDMDDFQKKFARVFKKSAIAEQMSFSWDQP